MNISATIANSISENNVVVSTNGQEKNVIIPGKSAGRGSSVNGGELLFLSLATCFCNDIYREAARREMDIQTVEVSVSGQFGGVGDPASNIVYNVKIEAPEHSTEEINSLIHEVDKVAEVHNTLRQGASVVLVQK